MVTDYLSEHCPTYVKTEDTSVVLFKYYYRRDTDGSYDRIANPVTTANPKTSGWYELAPATYGQEFKMHVEGIQMNTVAFISNLAARQLRDRFPKTVLPREIDGVDWSSSFFDTKWDEVVGSCPATVSTNFSDLKDFTLYIQRLVDMLVANWDKLRSSLFGTAAISALISEINSTMSPAPKNKTFRDLGYVFNVTTLDNASRDYDVYTLLSNWGCFNFRQMMQVLEGAYNVSAGRFSISQAAPLLTLIDHLREAARNIVKLSFHITQVTPVDGTSFECKTIMVPSTVEMNGTTYYRLFFNQQLVNGRRYAPAQAFNVGNGYSITLDEYKVESVPNVVYSSPYYAQFMKGDYVSAPPASEEVMLTAVQCGFVIYTDVPFSGM